MELQCVVVYTVIQIPEPKPPPDAGLQASADGCLSWIKNQIKRSNKTLLDKSFLFSLFVLLVLPVAFVVNVYNTPTLYILPHTMINFMTSLFENNDGILIY